MSFVPPAISGGLNLLLEFTKFFDKFDQVFLDPMFKSWIPSVDFYDQGRLSFTSIVT